MYTRTHIHTATFNTLCDDRTQAPANAAQERCVTELSCLPSSTPLAWCLPAL